MSERKSACSSVTLSGILIDVRHRHPEILGLSAGIAAEHVAGRLAHSPGRHLGVRIGAVAARKQPFLAEPALSAANGEGHDHTVADLQVGDLGSKLDHLAHVLVAEDVAALHGRLVSVEQVKVRAADRTRGDLDDRVPRVVDLRIRNRVHPDVAFSVPAQRAHGLFPPKCPRQNWRDRKAFQRED
jgi:hypothetical protein